MANWICCGRPIHGGANGPAGVENVINQHHTLALDTHWYVGGLELSLRLGAHPIVVPVKADIQGGHRNFDSLELRQVGGDTARNMDTPGVDAHDH